MKFEMWPTPESIDVERAAIFHALLAGRHKRDLCQLTETEQRGYFADLWKLAGFAQEERRRAVTDQLIGTVACDAETSLRLAEGASMGDSLGDEVAREFGAECWLPAEMARTDKALRRLAEVVDRRASPTATVLAKANAWIVDAKATLERAAKERVAARFERERMLELLAWCRHAVAESKGGNHPKVAEIDAAIR